MSRLAGIAIVALALGGAYLWIQHDRQGCTLGTAGTAMTITVEGPEARDYCDREIIRQRSGAEYLASERPTGVLVCRYTFGGLTYTVRDEGSLMVYGHDTCARYRALNESR